MRLQERGFGLLEALISGAVLIGIGGYAASFFKDQGRQMNAIEYRGKVEQLRMVLLNQFLSNEANCRCLFAGASDFPDTGTAELTGATPTELGRYIFGTPGDCSTASMAQVFVSKKGEDGLIAESIKIEDIKNYSGVYGGVLSLKLSPMKKSIAGVVERKIAIPINISTVASATPGMVSFQGCSSTSTLSQNLQLLLSTITPKPLTACIRDKSNKLHTVSVQCDPGLKLLSCAGGPGDQDETDEGFWILPDYTTNTCTLSIARPMCVAKIPHTYQKVVALCYK